VPINVLAVSGERRSKKKNNGDFDERSKAKEREKLANKPSSKRHVMVGESSV